MLDNDIPDCIYYPRCLTGVFLQNLNNEIDYSHRAKSQKTLAMNFKRLLVKIEVINCVETGPIPANRLCADQIYPLLKVKSYQANLALG